MTVTRMEHPPLHMSKQARFKLHEQDYFGAYSKFMMSQKQVKSKVEFQEEKNAELREA